MDTLALLNWTLPELARLLPDLPPRLTIVSAGDPMWRGGLSAPQSLFIHADRPLISENATSTLLHEVMHMALGVTARTGHDWIVEGLAEFYSLELLHRSGTISPQRYAQARTDLATWAKDATDLCKATSTGATTALAVGLLADLDSEIRKQTAGDASLDDVTRQLTQIDGRIDLDQMAAIANEITGANSDTLHIDKLPGCRTLQSGK
jgi:predicted metalloprotease with PDZ domain